MDGSRLRPGCALKVVIGKQVKTILESIKALFIVALLLGLVFNSPASAVQKRKPNIIFILADDLGYGDVGPYGQKQIKTPNIDRLAAEGTRFTQAYAGGTVCAPSRSALMTGLHTGHAPVRANAGTIPLRPEDTTVAEVLHQAGYRTGGFGKWGLGDAGSLGAPNKQGFDEFFGYLHQIHAHSYYPEFLWKNEEKYPLPKNQNGKEEQYSADLIAEQALQFIRNHKDEPFFLYAAFALPHGKFEIPSDEPYTNMNWPQTEKNFAAMVTRLDTQVGAIMRLLKELRLDDSTIVFFTSDNGGPSGSNHKAGFFRSNGSLRGEKGDLYEGGIRVPMIVRWPWKIMPGKVSDLPWAFWDFVPTVAALSGTKTPPNIDGISVLPTLLGAKVAGHEQQQHQFLYWEHHLFDRKMSTLRENAMIQAVRMGDWKGVRLKPNSPLELYDLKNDHGETMNIATKHPEIVFKLEAYMKTARTEPRPHNTGSFEYAH